MKHTNGSSLFKVLAMALTLVILTTPTSAQLVGGEQQLLHQWDGVVDNYVFGNALDGAGDVNGDGFDDVIVGDYLYSPGGQNYVGIVYVYSGLDGLLLYQWQGSAAGDHFGVAVAGAGDVNGDGFADLAVGSPYSQNEGVYVYSGADGSLLYQWTGGAFGYFGISVDGAGDLNADGFDDVIVGADTFPSGSFTNAGSVFVYSGADGSLLYRLDGTQDYHQFGRSVSSVGDTNGDGVNDIVVGATQSAFSNAGPGEAFLFSGATGSLLHQWPGAIVFDQFGYSVSGAGDVNGDGFHDVIVGAPYADQGGFTNNGSAFVYSGSSGVLLHQWNGSESYLLLGKSVSEIGDANRDGYDDVIINAPYSSITNFGTVGLYSGKDGTLVFERSNRNYLGFGNPATNAGDVNGDGYLDIVASAQSQSTFHTGSVFVFSFVPFLAADVDFVSASAGGTVHLELDFPKAAGYSYKVLLSQLGMGPTNYGVDIPLSLDTLLFRSFAGIYPVPASNMHGTLDATGKASANFTAPAGLPLAMVGRTYYLAAIANQPPQLPEFSSIAITVEITP